VDGRALRSVRLSYARMNCQFKNGRGAGTKIVFLETDDRIYDPILIIFMKLVYIKVYIKDCVEQLLLLYWSDLLSSTCFIL
jgi:hypothetical protein